MLNRFFRKARSHLCALFVSAILFPSADCAVGNDSGVGCKATSVPGMAVNLSDHGFELSLDPVLLDQELDPGPGSPTYWEGAVRISGTKDSGSVSGRGYLELVGYASVSNP